MTFANPLLQNYTALGKSPLWPVSSTKAAVTTQNTANNTYDQPPGQYTMTVDNPMVPQTPPKLPKLKLEMEMFSDLTTYCQQAIPTAVSLNIQNSQDELNTPTFELKAPLDFDRQPAGSDKDATTLNDQPLLKIKSELSDLDNLNLENSVIISEDIFPVRGHDYMGSLHSSSSNGSDDSIVINSPDSYAYVLSPEDVGYFSYAKRSTPAPVKTNLSRMNSYDKDYQFNGDANCSLIVDSKVNKPATFPTPESSRGSTPELKIDVNQKLNEIDNLQTPDIIDTLDSFDCEKDFNILNFINEEDIKAASELFPSIQEITTADQIPVLPPDRTHVFGPPPEETHTYALPPEESQSQKKIIRKRRIKREEDDDEDYVPPSKRRPNSYKSRGKSSSHKRMLLDMVINKHIDEELSKTSRRGRPPKSRISSISSDSSEQFDTEEARYREMRDKNNEASRRSRFKRKLKERAVEHEADELADRNIKLKAQVEELERTVTTFRNNLMKLLLKK